MPNRKNQLWREIKQAAPMSIIQLFLGRRPNYRTATIVSLSIDLAQINRMFTVNRPALPLIRARPQLRSPRYLIEYDIIKVDVDSKNVDRSGFSIIVNKKPETKEEKKQLSESLKKYSRMKLNQEGSKFEGKNVIMPSDVDYKRMSKRELLRNKRKYFRRIVNEAKTTEIRRTPRGFKGMILKDTKAPDYWSLGIQGDVGSYEDECVSTAIMSFQCDSIRKQTITRTQIYQDMDCKRGDNITLQMVYDYHTKHNLKAYFVDATNRVIKIIDGNSKDYKVGFYKINNKHIYPIHDKDTQNEIIYKKKIELAELSECKDTDIVRYDGVTNIDDYKQKVIVMSQDQITNEIKHSYEIGLIVENISCSNSGAIKRCSYKNKWLIVFDDYEKVLKVLSICREMPVIKNIKS